MVSLLINDPVDVVGSGCVSLLAPGDFVGLIVLIIIPGVLSLGVWRDVGFAVAYWVNSLILLCENSRKCHWIFCRIKIVSSDRFDVGFPFSLIGLVNLLISPSIISLVISRNS